MKALRLAFCFVLVPKLFISLFLFPLLIGFVAVYGQLLATGLVLDSMSSRRDAESLQKSLKDSRDNNVARLILYGSGTPPSPVAVCRWTSREVDGKFIELPPAECKRDRLDVAIHVDDPQTFDTSQYEEILNGNVERLHVCRSCRPDVVIDASGSQPHVDTFSIQGMLVLSLLRYSDDAHGKFVEAFQKFDHVNSLIGAVHFHSPDFREPLALSEIRTSAALTLNVAGLAVLALWLALKAHRKVLDYFARNGALLPMVAAVGKSDFYCAIWLLTAMRVGAFLSFAVPMVWFGLAAFIDKNEMLAFVGHDLLELSLWCLAIFSSLGLATLVASVADLKHRHHILSFIYRYVPLGICLIGGFVWAFSFFLDGSVVGIFRSIVASAPLAGMTPVLLAPIFKPNLITLTAHSLLTIMLVIALMRRNAKWFAAHLEEL